MKKINKNLIFVLLVIITVALMLIYALNKKNAGDVRTVIYVPLEKCKSQQPICEAELNELNVKISFEKDIYYLQPFMISVLTENKASIEIESIHVDFKMEGMDLGLNRFRLSKVSYNNKKQKWTGKAILPICVTGRADWFSVIEVVTKQNKYLLSVPVLVKQPVN